MPFYGQYTGFGGGTLEVYDSLITILTDLSLTSDLKLCLDAGDSVSFAAGEDWIDRSGNLGDDEFHLGSGTGADAADPTFNGTVGGLTSSDYFSFDGGDYFTYGASNPAWVETYHKDNAILAFCIWIHDPGGTNICYFGTGDFGYGDGTTFYRSGTSNLPIFRTAFSNGSYGYPISVTSSTAITADAWNFIGVALSESVGSNGGFLYLNGTEQLFTSTATNPTTDAAAEGFKIGATGAGTGALLNNTRVAEVAMWQGGTVLTPANFDSIYAATKGRFGV